MPDKEKIKLASTEKRKADDIDQIKDLKKVKKYMIFIAIFISIHFLSLFFLFRSRRWKEKKRKRNKWRILEKVIEIENDLPIFFAPKSEQKWQIQ